MTKDSNVYKTVKIADFEVANNKPFFLIAGPCQIESLDHSLYIAEAIHKICERLKINYVFKSSFDKANRTSINSCRGVGIEEGLKILASIKQRLGIPVLTDVHLPEQMAMVAEVADVLQIPAFLCRQTDLLAAAAATKKPLHIKKMQSLAPWVMDSVVKKLASLGDDQVMLSDRGTAFGYGTQIIDMRSFPVMARYGTPVTIDCTHAVQHPGGTTTSGNRDMAQVLASAAVAVGVAGVFMEVHQKPEIAPSDAATMIELKKLRALLKRLTMLDKIAKRMPLQFKNYNLVL